MAEEEHKELASIRKALRLTLDEMAPKVGALNSSQYKNWEYGRARVPRQALVRARALLAGERISDVGEPRGAMSETEVPVPYIGRVAASSKIAWANPLEADLTEYLPVHMVSMRGIFCARVDGDSMMPLLQPEDLAVFKAAEYARTGSIVYYVHEETQTATIKVLKHDGVRPVLHPLNPAYEQEPANGKCLGILVGFVRTIGKRTITDYDPEGLRPDFF